jgi:hypothetical protein
LTDETACYPGLFCHLIEPKPWRHQCRLFLKASCGILPIDFF